MWMLSTDNTPCGWALSPSLKGDLGHTSPCLPHQVLSAIPPKDFLPLSTSLYLPYHYPCQVTIICFLNDYNSLPAGLLESIFASYQSILHTEARVIFQQYESNHGTPVPTH